MNWHKHFDLNGSHAFLGASKYHWINYDENKLIDSYNNFTAAQRGTEIHDFAAKCITMKQKLPRAVKTLNLYVNDAVTYKMTPEQVLYYSDNCYGTADAISFRDDILRIHDLKTGQVPAHIEQLEIYAALFCLEYRVKPEAIDIELRLYQNDEVLCHKADANDIQGIMDKIVSFDRIIGELRTKQEA